MSRQPRLNTSLRQQVYSYVETPIEMSPPGFHTSNSADIPTDQTTTYNDQISTTNPSQHESLQTHPDAISVASQELEQARQIHLQERQALALRTTCLTEHPALSAPYGEENTLPKSPPAHSSSQYQSPPYSPGPLPEKRPTDFEYTSPQKISIAPDTNPLQSPRSPIHRMGTFPSTNQESQPDSANALMSELVAWECLALAFSTAERNTDYCANLEEKIQPTYWDTKPVTGHVPQW
ncbi:DUF614 domain protein [Talaromyces marneffei ATCC 18224]|uniref:DUF614 domain protein n=2 Tax=Talaromyces marneffei TaxID=37727 RepID=B6Q6D4_TALMQ|nr:DUF614 domain protein [Talaromyces marneffei ATCC 18224]